VNWQQQANRFIHKLEQIFDWMKYQIGPRINGMDPIMIVPYLGFGSPEFIELRGRVIEDKGIIPSKDTDRIFKNLLNMYRRFESDEIPNARVIARFHGLEQQVVADEEGCFEVSLHLDQSSAADFGRQDVELELLEPKVNQTSAVNAVGQVLIISPEAEYGVISDIDDTIVYTGVTSRLKMAYTVLLKNAYTRLPLEGVAGFYHSLQESSQGNEKNPLFYVSSSPWNMYDLFREFFEIHDIPSGPMFLRDWGFERNTVFTVKNRNYKMGVISKILDSFPYLQFILIGDSGEEDPEIYADVIQLYPQRILAAYIRSVKHDPKRESEIQILADKVDNLDSTMILAEDTQEMAEHAAQQGWIILSPAPQPGE
jgi:phosphatidate phosphatase APP1